ncbi:zinc chelation protein SecC [Vibrio harveyi]|uniref:zinc chelation protein SecC n=1 Tax=Vibrio harveyi TaxID=669 RepID=UPI00165EB1E5|nr:zinc chelation protein SecC [Vibrio harveyi]
MKLTTSEHFEEHNIDALIEKYNQQKAEAVDKKEEEAANQLWRAIESLKLNKCYVTAFEKLGKQEYRDAWCDLEQCEIACSNLIENATEEFLKGSRVYFIRDAVKNLQSLFPYCLFMSPGFVVGYYTCSICGHKIRPRSRCGHQKGRIYCGELCVHIAHDMEFKEVSIVKNPVQKYSVLHNDETLDFGVLEYLVDSIEHAFEPWDVEWTTQAYPIDMFSNVALDSECPCKSELKFGECCSNKCEVEIPHVNFIFESSKDPEKLKNRFPY